jgi:hypothetical protein
MMSEEKFKEAMASAISTLNRRCAALGELSSDLYEEMRTYGDREEWDAARAHQAGLIEAVILLEGLFAGAGKGEAL